MWELIWKILNCDNVLESCRQLDILGKNWKLILLDSGIDNLSDREFGKKFGRYEICGLGDYSHCYVLNREMLTKQINVPVKFSTCINYDSNVSSYINSMFFKNREDDDLVNMIQYIRKYKFQTTCQHYAFEVSLNLYPVNEMAVYNTLYAESMLANMTDKMIEERNFTPFVLPEDEYQKIYTNLQNIKNDKGKNYELFEIIYSMLLKAFIIKSEKKKGNRQKIEQFLEFVFKSVGCYLENEVYLIGKYLCDGNNIAFFRHMQQNRSKDKFLKDVRGIAWDLCHLRMVLKEMESRNLDGDITFLHCFASFEEGLVEILKCNQIKRILYFEDKAYYKYEHNVFEIEEAIGLKERYEGIFRNRVKNCKMKGNCSEPLQVRWQLLCKTEN